MNTLPRDEANGQPPLSTTERKVLALQRLEGTRSQLIQCLYPAPDQSHHRAEDAGSGLLSLLLGRLQRPGRAPGSWRTARALARRWWNRQSWRVPAELVATTLAQEARPLIRRHPWACLGAAAALGATLVLARPWAMRHVRQQTQGWHQHLGGMLWQQLAQAPVQLALAGALTAWLNERARRPADGQPGTAAAAPPASTQTPPG